MHVISVGTKEKMRNFKTKEMFVITLCLSPLVSNLEFERINAVGWMVYFILNNFAKKKKKRKKNVEAEQVI